MPVPRPGCPSFPDLDSWRLETTLVRQVISWSATTIFALTVDSSAVTLALVEARVATVVQSAAVAVARHAMASAVSLCWRPVLADAPSMGAVPYRLPDVVAFDLRHSWGSVAKKVLNFSYVLSSGVVLFQSLQSWTNVLV